MISELMNNLMKLFFVCTFRGCRYFEWWFPSKDDLRICLIVEKVMEALREVREGDEGYSLGS